MAEIIDEASRVMEEYKRVLDHKKQLGILTQSAENERFYAGKQWPAQTEKTKNLPRPVFNIIKRIVNHKVASVMNENIKMMYSPSEVTDDEFANLAGERFTQAADVTWEDIKQDQLNEKALKKGANTGLAVWHYYFDPTTKGGLTKSWVGKVKGEVINMINFFPGNPQSDDVQKQPFNIITSRDLVSNVKKEAKANGVPPDKLMLITGDKETEDQAFDMAKQEVTGSDKVTVITKYWKEDVTTKLGENQYTIEPRVHFLKVASGVVIKPKVNTKLKLYPIAIMPWEEREQSIFGMSETEELIPNQKIINFIIGMYALSVQQTAWPKMLVNKLHVQQQITNTPGEIINDNSPDGRGVHYLTPGQVSTDASVLVDKILEYTKEVTGANESALGEKISSDLNASAIMMLQKAAGIPIESLKRRFYQAMEDVGRIWEDMWKVYYVTERMMNVKDENGEESSVPFRGSDYADIELNMKIDIGPSSAYSETLAMSSLDKLFDGQHITLQQYLQYAPKNVIPFKDRLLKEIEEQMQQQANDPMQIISQLKPEEQQRFMSLPPQQQQMMLQQVMGQQPQMQQMMG